MKKLPPLRRYQTIAEDLKLAIIGAEIQFGQRLPSERQLMTKYGVHRNTIRQAIALLENEGLVQTELKRGSYVALKSELPQSTTPDLPVSGRVLLINPWNSASTAMTQIANGLTESVKGTGVSILRFNSNPTNGMPNYVLPSLEMIEKDEVCGLILWAHSGSVAEDLSYLKGKLPVVLIDRRVPGLESDVVRTNDIAGGKMVTEHLLDKGHRGIAFISDDPFVETVRNRWWGYALAHHDRGLEVNDSMFVSCMSANKSVFEPIVSALLSNTTPKVTALVCSNDSLASTILTMLRRLGYRVPLDVAVTGYGDLLPNMTEALELTSVRQPFVDVGVRAGELMMRRLSEGGLFGHNESEDIQLPVDLIIRSSSG